MSFSSACAFLTSLFLTRWAVLMVNEEILLADQSSNFHMKDCSKRAECATTEFRRYFQ